MVDSQYAEVSYVVVRGAYQYPVPWPFNRPEDIFVYYTDSDGGRSAVARSNYSISADRQWVTVNAVYNDTVLVGLTLTLARHTPRTQNLDLHPKAPIIPTTLENHLDLLEFQIQEIEDESVKETQLREVVSHFEEADANLSAAIQAEAVIRAREDAAIRTAMANEDVAIRADIAAEAELRKQGDLENGRRISEEGAVRASADNSQQVQINQLNQRITELGRLGRKIGVFARVIDLPNVVGPEVTVNDWAIVTRGKNSTPTQDISAIYTIVSISSFRQATWEWIQDLGTDLSGKTDKVIGAIPGDLAGLNAEGNLTDSGLPADRIVLRPIGGTVNELVTLTATGELDTSGYHPEDFMPRMSPSVHGNVAIASIQGIAVDSGVPLTDLQKRANPAVEGHIAVLNATGQVVDSGLFPDDIGGGTKDALPLGGGTMLGNINMDGNKITNLPWPSEPSDPVTLGALDSTKAEFNSKFMPMVPLTGARYVGTMQNGVPIWDLANGTELPFTYAQRITAASRTWNLSHGLGVVLPVIRIYDASGNRIIPEVDLVQSTPTTLVLHFQEPTVGLVFLYAGFEALYQETFAEAASWTVHHGLYTTEIVVEVVDATGAVIRPTITPLDMNSLRVDFYTPVAGSVSVYGGPRGSGSGDTSIRHAEVPIPDASTVWAVRHNLNFANPVVIAVSGQSIIEPVAKRVIDDNTVELTFRQVISGRAFVFVAKASQITPTPGGGGNPFPHPTNNTPLEITSGSTWTAIANGWVQVQGTTTGASAWGLISAGQLQIARSAPAAGIPLADFLPVTEGATVTIAYDGMTISSFKFIPTAE